MDALIAGYLLDAVHSSGLTYRQLSAETGMSINRIGIILRQEPPPATVGEIRMLAGALGLKAWELVERAEQHVSAEFALAASDDDDWQARQEAENE